MKLCNLLKNNVQEKELMWVWVGHSIGYCLLLCMVRISQKKVERNSIGKAFYSMPFKVQH